VENQINKAFTLIEMLVVIAIIAIIATLLFPVLGKARESGRNAQCASNLRQLQLASINYATDNAWLPQCKSFWHDDGDGSKTHWAGWVAWYDIPVGKNQTGSPGNGKDSWYGANGYQSITNGSLWGYINTLGVYVCPTFAMKGVSSISNPKRSYAMSDDSGGKNISGLQGATLMMFADDKGVFGTVTENIDSWWTTNNISTDLGTWHTGHGNVVFVDGHIERR
jgi:prepilin-type N-terminal cleavage/methylation domain-containing protein/prepilin-type processing-associated H-X9-DG protein